MMRKNLTFLLISLLVILCSGYEVFAQNIVISAPAENESFQVPALIEINADVEGVIPGEPVHLMVVNNQTGYRKLKMGNNPYSLYSPPLNVLASGNDKVEITLKDFTGAANWSKIRFRPASIGSLGLAGYVEAAGGSNGDWFTITIPLAEFDASIDFTGLTYIEFPYSADAGNFEIGISEIRFTGSSTPVEWFGTNKHDNLHNGNGGPGELVAYLEPGTEAISDVEKVEFYANANLLGEDTEFPFSLNFEIGSPGQIAITTKVYYNDGTSELSQAVNIIATEPPVFDLGISIASPQQGQTPEAPANVVVNAEVVGADPRPRAYIHVTNELTGYRKLQLGYNSGSVYGPAIDAIAAGNDTLEIELKDNLGTTNWSKIRIRPSAIGSLSILPYVNLAGGVGPDGATLKIPLSDFDPTIDFSSIAYFQFPYSADAGNFDLEIFSIKFTGGTKDFVWFGEDKTDNAHNGNGGPGELVAEILIPVLPDNIINGVALFHNGELVLEDKFPPFTFNLSGLDVNTHTFEAVVTNSSGQSALSNPLTIEVIPPAVAYSSIDIQLSNPPNGSEYPAPAQFELQTNFSGILEPQPSYLSVSNEQPGYCKLKFGNNPDNIYKPGVDVLYGGNNTLEITMKKFNSRVNWNKIRIRPQALGSVILLPYVEATGTDLSEWTTISIPLSDFDSSIDFSNLAYFEFPYSADAGTFTLGIQKVEFTGGSSPYLWFGEDKLNNAHNGNGGPGELVATLVEAVQEELKVALVEFFIDGLKIGEATDAPWNLDMFIEDEGTYNLSAKLTDTDNLNAFSDTVQIHVDKLSPDQGILITVQLESVPQNISVSKAALKYNKNFAYSFALDDGRIDAYTYAFQLFNGGFIEANATWYPGLFYTDGCGNDIPFRGALAWNSVNSNYVDLHVNTPDYVKWNQLIEMYNAGWDVLNHSYSHAAYGNTDYNFEITQNREYVYQQTGIDMTHFVVPSGDNNYIQPAFDLGNKVVHTRTNSYLGYTDGLPVDDAIDFNDLKIYRKLISDDAFTPENITDYLENLSGLSTNGNHYWWSEFTHRVRYEQTAASLVFPTFEYYMNYIAQTWGKNGSDRIWMAPVQEVYEYLVARDKSQLLYALNGDQLSILLNTDDLPRDLRNYSLTIVIDSDVQINSAEITNGELISYNGTAAKKLINLQWDGSGDLKSGVAEVENVISENVLTNLATESIDVYPNPLVGNQLKLAVESEKCQAVSLNLVDMFGQTVLQKNISLNPGSNVFSIPLDEPKPGIYFVIVTLPCGNVITKKVSIGR